MNSKLLNMLLVAFAAGTAVAQAQEGFKIAGTTPTAKDGCMVYFDYQGLDGSHSDSTIVKDGKFAFGGAVTEPNFARMILDHEGKGKYMIQNIGDRLYFFVGNENYHMVIADSLKRADITGSPLHDEYVAFLDEIGGCFMAIMDEAGKTAASISNDDPKFNEKMNALRTKYDTILENRRQKELAYAKNNPSSIFAAEALRDVANTHPLSEIEPILANLSEEVRNLSMAKGLASRIEAEKTIQIGNIAPDFTQSDVDGNPISLSDFRGRYVLVDFWASWCAPCRAENPNLKKAYENHKDKGLEVLAVSLDDQNTRGAWLKAIETDGLPWIHVSDLKGWNNAVAVQYGVRGVPQNYLVDPEGKIVASNLRDERLHTVLEEVFGNP
ncbi:TlpA disulfide reductase family protein [Parapedobacter tibetensis]|uniref:TlpA disulfide reductase family protein n=1 Tax=Parapedobacter tibetensis TaxID=2972951 RepID=UPI00214D234F|nr:TlpA disulfide reductase family protein [Parapedobacter tibetensis]